MEKKSETLGKTDGGDAKIHQKSDLEYICSIKIAHEALRKNSVTLVLLWSLGCLSSIESTGICINKLTRTVGKSSRILTLIDKVKFADILSH